MFMWNHYFNHFVQVGFSHLPQQRRLNEKEREETKTMLKLKVNKKLLQNHLSTKSGKVVLLKNLHYLASSSKGDCDSNPIADTDKELRKIPGIVKSTSTPYIYM